MFGDRFTANQILNTPSPYEAKRLGNRITRVDSTKWHHEGYHLCNKGVREKFRQNPELLFVLKANEPKLLVEASMDHMWGTGVSLRDNDILNCDKWSYNGWLLDMLMEVIHEANEGQL